MSISQDEVLVLSQLIGHYEEGPEETALPSDRADDGSLRGIARRLAIVDDALHEGQRKEKAYDESPDDEGLGARPGKGGARVGKLGFVHT